MNPFDYAFDLVTRNEYDSDVPTRKDYKTFLINRTLSYYEDLVLYINEMNRYPDIDDSMNYDFLFHAIDKKNRKKKFWSKGKKYENMEIIKTYYHYSNVKAISVLSVLSDSDIDKIKKKLNKGGKS